MAVVVWQLFHFRLHVFLVFIAHFMHTFPPSQAISKCTYTVGGIDYKISAWTWIVRDGSVEYHINLCGLSVSDGDCKNAAVCKLTNFKDEKTSKQRNFGNYAKPKTVSAADGTGFTTEFVGTKGDCDRAANKVTRSSRVILKCGKVLGSPELTEAITGDSSCETVFEFVTSEACKNGAQNTVSEIPCYVYDKETDKKIDLSPLIRLTDGHAVASENTEYDLHINVCREITPSKNITISHTYGCPRGASSCRIFKNGKKENMGEITQLSILKHNPFNPKQIVLHYNASNTGTSCRGPHSTTIVFECPELFHQASGKGPRITADRDCHYDILWMTEYACAEAVLTNKSCVIQNEFVQFDLTPLKAEILDNYKVTALGAKGKTTYDYFINVCDSTHIPCPTAKNASVCQVVPNTKTAYNLGVTQELRYADGELTMIYKDGDRCHSSGFKRSTIISFKCNPKVDKGKPKFNEEDACLYLFDWETKYACPPSRRTGTKCQVTNSKGVRYDLSELVRMDSMNWLAIDGRHSNSDSEIYVSVCGELMNVKGKTDKCDISNAICIVNTKTKETRNLGKYKQPLVLNADGSMLLNYTDGDKCKTTTDNKEIKISSVITFLCHPGDLASPPVLVSSSLDNCTYEFMWRTAAACSLGVNTGEKCRVEDQNAGYVFDLTPLSQPTPSGKDYFRVDTNTSNFFQVAVCRGSNDSTNKCVADKKHGTNIGACQVKKVGNSHVMVGQSNDVLYYYDGMINLTYSDGEPCPTNSKQKTVTHMTFLCDEKASTVKLPEYDTEDSCTHNFRWRTKYACPAKVVECAVKSGEQQYDLSSLVKTADNWYTPANGGTAYINICRTLNLNSKVRRCKGTPAVCLVPQDSSKAGINLGEVSSAPSILSSTKEIVLVYTGGDICTGNTRYQTQIHFSCKRGSADSSPKFEAVDKCIYKFHWAVAAACAIENADGDNCMVKDPASDTTFNLMPLNTQFPNDDFTVNGTGGTRYRLSICGPLSQTCVSDSNAGACEVKSNGESISLGVATKKLHFQGEVISLKYINGARDPGTGRGRQVTIRFYCNPTVPLGTPKFVQQQKYEYVFDFQTSLACSAKAVQCSVTDNNGTKYDLTPLGLPSGNWEAVDTRPSQNHLHYFINVCRSVNSLPGGFTCAGGGIGGCQIDHKLNRGHNMGNVQSNPQVVGDGLLTLHYFGGDSCHNNKYHRSTRINFSCSKKMGSPIFVEETVDCIYVFRWSTPFACPVKSHIGTNCAVEVPEYGYTFNLSSLYTPHKNYSVMTSSKQEIVLNVCGDLSSTDPKCAKPVNAGACLKGKKVLGVANQKLTYNGDITLQYSTTKPGCSVDIVFQCDTGQHGAGQGPELVTQIDNGTMCHYRLTWNTDLACIPLAHTQCSIRVEKSESGSTYDLQYDFTSLSRRTGNWQAVNSADDAHNVMYFINVCSSVNNEGGATHCNPTAGVCKVETVNGEKRYLSLGVQRSSPKKDGPMIYLLYEEGELDPRCTGGKRRASTRIQMHCDNKDGDPLYVTFYPYLCRYEFMWQTTAACPLNKASGSAFNNCTALNPQQNNLFDLNHLHKPNDYSVQDKNQHYYFLNVCGPLSDANQKKCGSKTGICQLRKDQASFHHNAGNYNKRLTFQDGVLALTYDGGDYCVHSRTNRTTIISFVCNGKAGSTATLGTPVFVTESNDCTYYIDWHTSLACEKTIECLATNEDGVRFDLSALKKDDGNWPVVPQGLAGKPPAMYYINVCRGLVPMPGIQCPAGSSACLVNTTNNVPVSMGRVVKEPSIGTGKEVILVYSGGSTCNTDKAQKISTKIIFKCAEGSLGKPILGLYANCMYTIIWETSAACGRIQTVDSKSCTVYDNATAHLYDLKPLKILLQDYRDYEVFSPLPKKEKFLFNLCNGTAVQPKYGVCKVINDTYCSGYGLVSQTSLYFSHAEKFLTLKYCDPTCHNYKKMAMIVFMCDITADPGNPHSQPILESSSASQAMITWKTSLACPPLQEGCVHSAGGYTYDLQLLSSRTRSWHYKTTDGQEFWINICGGVNDGPEGCPPSASVCRRNGDEVDVLGIASTQRMTTSDDLIVMYHGQSSVKDCQTRPSVVFQFECGSHIGRPDLLSTVWSTCTFHFRWKTKAACKIERTKLDVTTDCKVTHPDTMKLVDFSQLSDRNWEVDSKKNKFYISICDKIRDENQIPHICTNKDKTVVCRIPTNDQPVSYELLSRTFFYEDLVFSLWLETTASKIGETGCPTATFVINFYCSKGAGKGKPEYLYRSAACHYVFDWETSVVCIKDQSTDIVDVANAKGALSSAGSKAGIAFGVIFIIALLIIAGAVLRKQERREYILFYIRSRYRRIFRKRDFKSPSYRYTKVDTSDEEQADLLLNMDEQQYVDESDDDDDDDILHL